MVSASLKKNVYGYMYECYTSNTTMYSISFYLIKRKDNYENSFKQFSRCYGCCIYCK